MVEDFWYRLAADSPVAEVVASVRDDGGPDLDDEDIVWSVEKARAFALYYKPKAFDLYEDASDRSCCRARDHGWSSGACGRTS